jgi:hypothetical protein
VDDAPLLPEPDRLDRLVTLLDAAFQEEGWHDRPHRLVSVEPDPDDAEGLAFGFRVLPEGSHPLDHLLGFVAPPAWWALGLVCYGWASPPTDGARPSAHPDRRRVRVVTLLARDGEERSTASLDDGTVVDEPGVGTVADALRRCLGLATAAPPVSTAELFAALWVGRIAAAERRLSWVEAAALHPAMEALAAVGGQRAQAEELIAAGRALHRSLSWGELRLRAAAGRQDPGVEVPADLAAWMDDGMFARWVLGGLPSFTWLLHRSARVVAPEVYRRLRRTLRSWGVDPPLSARVA